MEVTRRAVLAAGVAAAVAGRRRRRVAVAAATAGGEGAAMPLTIASTGFFNTGGAVAAPATAAATGAGLGAALPRIWYDASYVGWQALQLIVPVPLMLAWGTGWTSPQIATIPSGTVSIGTDADGSHAATTTVIDVEGADVTSLTVVAAWIAAQLAKTGGYAVNRPTIYTSYTNSNGWYLGQANDMITPLAGTYGYYPGEHYDLWLRELKTDGTGPVGNPPTQPRYTTLSGRAPVPAVATQYRDYTANGGSQYDTNIAWDPTWNPV